MILRSVPLLGLCWAALLCGCGAESIATARPEGVTAIGQVQGDGERSPLEGRTVTIEGVITGQFSRGLGGFFVQDQGDGDPRTSDAVFVIAGKDASRPRKLAAGDRVRVQGRVVEQQGNPQNAPAGASLTALVPAQVETVGRGAVETLELATAPADWEALEGMRVRIAGPLVVGSVGQLSRYGEVAAAIGGRLWQPSERATPGTPAFEALRAENARRRIVVDDASNQRDPRRVWYLQNDEGRNDAGADGMRAGMALHGVEGIVDQRHGSYRLQLTAKPDVRKAPRPPAPQVAGHLRVAAFNLENLFNGDGRGGGFPTERGARDADAFDAQLAKLVETIHSLAPDVAALMELENDGFGPDSSIAQLVAALNGRAREGANGKPLAATANAAEPATARRGPWRFVDAGRGPGNDAIRVALIYRADKVAPRGRHATLEAGPFGRSSRAPLAQTFVPARADGGSGAAFTVVANHFKSKTCNNATGDDADRSDGTGCWNGVRAESARRLHDWVAAGPTAEATELTLLVGDFNSYAMEEPVRLLRERGWADALERIDEQDRYSYVYDGMVGRLDHALLSPALAARLAGAALWHSNSDEPADAGYRGDNAPGPWRSSDHDPLVLGFDL